MIQNVDVFFTELQNDISISNVLNLTNKYNECFLVTKIVDDNIEFVGEISSVDQNSIKKAIKLQEFYSVDGETFRMILNNSIYVFKKFDNGTKISFVGVLFEKTNENRIKLMNKQSNFLLEIAEAW